MNGLFIFFRLREQWIAWHICAALEAIINILSGQYVLLILSLVTSLIQLMVILNGVNILENTRKQTKKLSLF